MDFIKRHKRLTRASLIGLLLFLVWLCWPDRRLAEVQALQKELFSETGKKMSSEERKAKFQELRQATERLSTAQKQELAKGAQQRKQQDLERYAKLSKKEQITYLDDQINRMQNFAKKGEGGKGGAGGATKQKSISSEDRDRMKRQRLDQSTPEFRAMFSQYSKDLHARMQARGVQATWR